MVPGSLCCAQDISRRLLIEEVRSRGVLEAASPEVQALFKLTEAGFYPLDTANKARPLLVGLAAVPALAQYDEALKNLVGLRVLQQMERVYTVVTIECARKGSNPGL